jgi:hypothetical protein
MTHAFPSPLNPTRLQSLIRTTSSSGNKPPLSRTMSSLASTATVPAMKSRANACGSQVGLSINQASRRRYVPICSLQSRSFTKRWSHWSKQNGLPSCSERQQALNLILQLGCHQNGTSGERGSQRIPKAGVRRLPHIQHRIQPVLPGYIRHH